MREAERNYVIPPAEKHESYCVILFDSIHDVLAAQEVFREHDVWHDLVPVPRDLSSDCGMAIEFRPGDLKTVRDVANDPRVKLQSV